MAESVEISDGFLINNLYKILYNEYGESGFKDIFEEIGISSDIERRDIGDEQVKRIQEWRILEKLVIMRKNLTGKWK
jgi:hypothetical protein